jgi:nickel-dependent lactate racemase
MVISKGSPESDLSETDVRSILHKGIPLGLYEGKRVLVLTPDRTRTCPLPMMVRLLREVIGARAARVDFMVALGTHTPLSREGILSLYGIDPGFRDPFECSFFNHEWNRPETFRCIGTLPPDEVERISGGRLREAVRIDINKKIFDYDLLLVMGPVFPHEVVGFSGGAKYLFPGISGGDFLHFFHWLGAVITCMEIIGKKDTPVRRLIHKAMENIPVPVYCLAMVVDTRCCLRGLYAGGIEDSWAAAADLSSKIHVRTKRKPFRLVLGRAPEMYDELWTAGKVMYKLEQVVADQGTLVIYGPHIREISRSWGKEIEQTGYHIRDYFLSCMEEYKNVPRGVLAHLTHVRGTGVFEGGVEKPRVRVVLATAIPEEQCRQVNLGYMNPDHIRLSDYMGREDEGVLFVDHAGEILYRLDRSMG